MFLMPFSRISQNGFNGAQSPNFGAGDTYGYTRRMPKIDIYNGGNRRNDTGEHFSEEIDQVNIRMLTVLLMTRCGNQGNRGHDGEESGNSA